MKKLTIVFIMLYLALYVKAQQRQEWEKYYDQLGDIEDAESESWGNTYDELCELAAHPINLSTATREELETLPFLNDQQIQEIIEYTYKYGGMKSWGELSLIGSLDYNRQKLLTFFTILKDNDGKTFPTWDDLVRHGRNEVLATARIPFYERAGDKDGYLGYHYKHWLKYSFQYGQYVKLGAVASQDAGEPFFAGRNSAGYDYYSLYLMLRRMGRLKALAVGRYRLRFGMGLILNNDFGFGKIATLSTLGRSANSIHAHSSRSEGNYLQGAAATVTIARGLDLTAFASYRDIDATLNRDSSSIATILATGYHRTQSEMDRKHNTSEFLGGGNIHFFKNGFHIGATGFYTSFDRELKPKTEQLFRQYYPEGKAFWNVSTDYGYVSRRLSINGETATGNSHAVATINSLSYQLTGDISLMALQRFYSYKYYSLYSRSFSESGSVQNESGVYIGTSWHPSRAFSLMAYTDYAYFAWPRYQVSESSHVWDNLISMVYQKKRITLLARYRIKLKQKDNTDNGMLTGITEQRARASFAYNNGRWSTKTQGDAAYCRSGTSSFGYMISENISYSRHWLDLNASIGYFSTDDYDSRVCTYERGTLCDFSFPSFSGEGMRYAVNICADISSAVMIIAKLGTTRYFDRAQISSGPQQIDRCSQTDLDLQMRWQF